MFVRWGPVWWMVSASAGVGLMLALAPATAHASGPRASGPAKPRVEDPTYYRDVLPIVQNRCSPCHTEDGIAGLNLHDVDTASQFSKVMASATAAGIMPPFPPDPGCADYEEAARRTLDADQLQTLQRWAELDAPAGDPADAPPPPEPMPHPYGDPDLRLAPSQPFLFDNQQKDLYWCFRFDPGLSDPRDIISAFVTPDNESVVHHVIVFREPEGAGKELDLPGFGCGGAPEHGEFLFGWVPGAQPTLFPEGYGMRLHEDDALIMQVHYHAYPGALPTDQTSIDLWFADQPTEKNVQVVWTGSYDILVPPGLSKTVEGTCTVPDDFEPVELLAIAPHMHQAGTAFSSHVEHTDGTQTCLVDIPDWDFDWQGSYRFVQPVTIGPGDVVHTQCKYKNDSEETISFGEGTSDEMCFSFNFVVQDSAQEQALAQYCFDEPQPEPAGGCGCASTPRRGAWWVVLALMVPALRTCARRRSRARAGLTDC